LKMSTVPFLHSNTPELGINASLGSNTREAIVLITMVVGASSLGIHRRHRELFILTLFTMVFTLSPLSSKAMSTIFADNASWRLAWAAPVPLLMAIMFSGLMTESLRQKKLLSGIIAIISIITFVCADRWVLSKDNNVSFSKPSPTISPDYFSTAAIMTKIKVLTGQPVILATDNIAAWVPLTNPGTRIIMPGHYMSVLQLILESNEYKERVQLFSMMNDNRDISPETVIRQVELFRKYGINAIVARKNEDSDLAWVKALSNSGIVPKSQFDINGYVVFVY